LDVCHSEPNYSPTTASAFVSTVETNAKTGSPTEEIAKTTSTTGSSAEKTAKTPQ
jgi:hypothetical protein